MEKNSYLGKERVGRLLLQFAVPSTLALVISCLYNIVDQIFVGNGIGYLGNAATGIVFPITVIGWGATALFEAFPVAFIRLFGAGEDQLYVAFAVRCLRIYLSLLLFTCLQKACAMFLQSIGHAKTAVPLSVLRDVLLIAFSLFLPTRLGVTGIFWAAPASDVLAMAVTALVVRKVWRSMDDPAQSPDRVR